MYNLSIFSISQTQNTKPTYYSNIQQNFRICDPQYSVLCIFQYSQTQNTKPTLIQISNSTNIINYKNWKQLLLLTINST